MPTYSPHGTPVPAPPRAGAGGWPERRALCRHPRCGSILTRPHLGARRGPPDHYCDDHHPDRWRDA